MANSPVDLDKKQVFKDLFLRGNKYELNDDYVIKDGKKHPVAILVPGGGYQMVCSFIEGVPIAKRLNELGVSAFIVYYRVRKKGRYPTPQNDLALAIKTIIDNADKYHIDMDNYSIWGASAGGHLAASFGSNNMGYAKYNLPKPACLVLAYPVISMDPKYTHMGSHDNLLGKDASKQLEEETSVEKHVDKNYPKTFIWCFDHDNNVNSKNTLMMKKALEDNNIAHECLIYSGDLHGIGPGSDTEAAGWIDKAYELWRKTI